MKTKTKRTTKPSEIIEKNRPILPNGIHNFYELVTRSEEYEKSFLFVDKSLFIREFINQRTKVTLVTRPRRFGKTLTLSMLAHFLAPEVAGMSTKGLFDGLKISKYPGIMKKQGQFPVIFLTLKRAKGITFEIAFEEIKEEITKLFERHNYLLKSDKISATQKERFQLYIKKTATKVEYGSSLAFLCTLLFRHTGKKVYILLDEYDTPINDAYIYDYYEECRGFLAKMFQEAFKDNDYLEQSLITGILKIAKASLFSDLSNLQVYTMLDDALYTQYFGFTEEETDDLLDRAGLFQKAHQLKEMYNGYNLEGYTLYNPFSIVSFCDQLLLKGEKRIKEALQPYWMNTGGTHLIGHLIKNNTTEIEKNFVELLNKKSIQTEIDQNIVFDPELRHDSIGFWSILLLAGYLKSLESIEDEFGDKIHTLCFPNEEVRRSMRQLLLRISFRQQETKVTTKAFKSLAMGEVEPFIAFVKKYLGYALSYFDGNKDDKEPPYHLFMLGIVSFFANTHHVRSNRESGKGRYDIGLTPKKAGMKGIIIETKAADEGEDLKKVAKKALQQIKDRQYTADMEARGITDYVLLGMAFYGKEMEYACESSAPGVRAERSEVAPK